MAISKPAPNPGTHQTPVETLSDVLSATLILSKNSRVLGAKSRLKSANLG